MSALEQGALARTNRSTTARFVVLTSAKSAGLGPTCVVITLNPALLALLTAGPIASAPWHASRLDHHAAVVRWWSCVGPSLEASSAGHPALVARWTVH